MELNEKTVSEIAEKLSVTSEVLKNVLNKEAKEDDVKSFNEKLGNLHIFSEEELEKRITNEKKAEVEAKKKELVAEISGNTYGAIDKRVLSDTGVEKLPSEEKDTAAYIDRAYKLKYSKNADDFEKLKKENEAIKKGNFDIQKVNDEVERLKKSLSDKDKAIAENLSTIEKLEQQSKQEKKQNTIDKILSQSILSIPIDADEKLLDSQRDFLRYKFDQKYEIDLQDGKPILKDRLTGEEIKNKRTADYMKPDEVIKEFAPTVVKLKQQNGVPKGGAGLRPSLITKESIGELNPGDYPTPKELKEHLKQSGISQVSEEGKTAIRSWFESDHGKAYLKQNNAV